MEIGQLEAFERTCREGNFTRAAQAMDLTQPAVSARITTLEAELGGPLFERQGRQLQLTPLGERFLPYARRILNIMADGMQAVRDYHSGHAGEVRIAAPTPFVLSFLVQTLDDFRYQHPKVDILIRERNKTTIFDMLQDNTITLGFVNTPVYSPEFDVLARFQDPIRAVVAPSHPLARESQPALSDVYQHTIFRVSMFPQMTAFIDAVVEQGRHGSGGAVIAVPMVMALRLVTLGQGVTFLPESYVKPAVESGELVVIHLDDMPPLMSEPVLIVDRTRTLDHVHQEFVRILKARWRHLMVAGS